MSPLSPPDLALLHRQRDTRDARPWITAQAAKKQLEKERDLEGIDITNIVSEGGRRQRMATHKPTYRADYASSHMSQVLLLRMSSCLCLSDSDESFDAEVCLLARKLPMPGMTTAWSSRH